MKEAINVTQMKEEGRKAVLPISQKPDKLRRAHAQGNCDRRPVTARRPDCRAGTTDVRDHRGEELGELFSRARRDRVGAPGRSCSRHRPRRQRWIGPVGGRSGGVITCAHPSGGRGHCLCRWHLSATSPRNARTFPPGCWSVPRLAHTGRPTARPSHAVSV